jgi:hypothetical protein
MGLPGIYAPARASGKSAEIWCLEWTYSDAGGAVSLDTDQSDQDPRIATPVADSGTAGKTNIVFPKSTRVRVLHASVEPPSGDLDDGTDYVLPVLTEISASAGTAVFRMVDVEGTGDLNDPTSGARARLVLLLDRP